MLFREVHFSEHNAEVVVRPLFGKGGRMTRIDKRKLSIAVIGRSMTGKTSWITSLFRDDINRERDDRIRMQLHW